MTPVRRLGEYLPAYGGPQDDPLPPAGGFTASVSVLLRPGAGEIEILLIRRPESARDPWSGHMAFPGGRRDAVDTSLMETAIRETREETGITLGDAGHFLGCLSVVAPLSPLLPPLAIVPFVFAIRPETPLMPSPAEVASAHWIPLPHFQDPAARTVYRLESGSEHLSFPGYRTEGGIVWGLTHRILDDLLTRIG